MSKVDDLKQEWKIYEQVVVPKKKETVVHRDVTVTYDVEYDSVRVKIPAPYPIDYDVSTGIDLTYDEALSLLACLEELFE